ncbi:MAG TPA: sigma factor-like helix-turn-helix DNA-binding protein [Bacteroidota bacterium]|nr:sigma factor-like helix-turn-helix DNA-binding protein [Bacteroidota bacterium]
MNTQAHAVSAQTDAALLKQVAGRDASALGGLYDRYSPILYTILFDIIRDQSEAEVLLEGVFLQAWEKANSFTETASPPLVWLSRIARDLGIERRSVFSGDTSRNEDKVALEPRSAIGSAGLATTMSPYHQEVTEALAALPDEQRAMIELAYFQRTALSELAAHFQLPRGVVKAKVGSAMSTLYTRLHHLHETRFLVNSLYLEELAALNALGILDGDDMNEFRRLVPHMGEDFQRTIEDYARVASLIGHAASVVRIPPQRVKERLMKRIRESSAREV